LRRRPLPARVASQPLTGRCLSIRFGTRSSPHDPSAVPRRRSCSSTLRVRATPPSSTSTKYEQPTHLCALAILNGRATAPPRRHQILLWFFFVGCDGVALRRGTLFSYRSSPQPREPVLARVPHGRPDQIWPEPKSSRNPPFLVAPFSPYLL